MRRATRRPRAPRQRAPSLSSEASSGEGGRRCRACAPPSRASPRRRDARAPRARRRALAAVGARGRGSSCAGTACRRGGLLRGRQAQKRGRGRRRRARACSGSARRAAGGGGGWCESSCGRAVGAPPSCRTWPHAAHVMTSWLRACGPDEGPPSAAPSAPETRGGSRCSRREPATGACAAGRGGAPVPAVVGAAARARAARRARAAARRAAQVPQALDEVARNAGGERAVRARGLRGEQA